MVEGHVHAWVTESVVLTATGSRTTLRCTGCPETMVEESQEDRRPPLPPPPGA